MSRANIKYMMLITVSIFCTYSLHAHAITLEEAKRVGNTMLPYMDEVANAKSDQIQWLGYGTDVKSYYVIVQMNPMYKRMTRAQRVQSLGMYCPHLYSGMWDKDVPDIFKIADANHVTTVVCRNPR